VLADIGDDVKTVESDLGVNEVYKQRSHDVHQLETLYNMLFVWSDEGEVSYD
jgi:hypothetical protein